MPVSILSDPRAQDLLAAVAEDVERLAGAFRHAAVDASAIAEEVGAAAGDPVWQGAAAMAFRHAVGPLPGEMARIADGYGAVANALDGYAGVLSELTGALRGLIVPLQDDGPAAATATTAALRILDAFEVAREQCRTRVAAAQSSAPVVAAPPPGRGSASGETVIGAGVEEAR